MTGDFDGTMDAGAAALLAAIAMLAALLLALAEEMR